jgi:hypothetical protein
MQRLAGFLVIIWLATPAPAPAQTSANTTASSAPAAAKRICFVRYALLGDDWFNDRDGNKHRRIVRLRITPRMLGTHPIELKPVRFSLEPELLPQADGEQQQKLNSEVKIMACARFNPDAKCSTPT